jgi:hypothetical protein
MIMRTSIDIPARVRDLLQLAQPNNVRFIKLGRQSAWWRDAIEGNTLFLGFHNFDSALCAAGKWSEARQKFEASGQRSRPADNSRALNQVREFYECPEGTLWFTIEDDSVWWCFAEQKVIDLQSNEVDPKLPSRKRVVIDRWRSTDINGNPLQLDLLTTKITKTASFQETIAKPSGASDLLNRIRAIESEYHGRVSTALNALESEAGNLLDQLHQDDFELLIELIFSSSGWKRVSRIGGTRKTLDIAMLLPTTGERCFVQVKSETNQSTLNNLISDFGNLSNYSKMFFVYHSPSTLFATGGNDKVVVWNRSEIASQVIRAGLVTWLLDRTA